MLRRMHPTILAAGFGLVLLGAMGLMYGAPEATTAAITGIAALARDIVASEDKVTEADAQQANTP